MYTHILHFPDYYTEVKLNENLKKKLNINACLVSGLFSRVPRFPLFTS